MLLDEGDENFVRQRSGLPELRIGTDADVLLENTRIELNLGRSGRRDFLIVAKQRARDAQQIALHVELVAALCVGSVLLPYLDVLHRVAGQLYGMKRGKSDDGVENCTGRSRYVPAAAS